MLKNLASNSFCSFSKVSLLAYCCNFRTDEDRSVQIDHCSHLTFLQAEFRNWLIESATIIASTISVPVDLFGWGSSLMLYFFCTFISGLCLRIPCWESALIWWPCIKLAALSPNELLPRNPWCIALAHQTWKCMQMFSLTLRGRQRSPARAWKIAASREESDWNVEKILCLGTFYVIACGHSNPAYAWARPPVWTTEDELCSLNLLSRRESTCSVFRTTYSDLFRKDANKIECHWAGQQSVSRLFLHFIPSSVHGLIAGSCRI